MVGPVKADGLTVDEFTAQLQQGLSRYIINPDITVNVTKLGGVRVYVFGEISFAAENSGGKNWWKWQKVLPLFF